MTSEPYEVELTREAAKDLERLRPWSDQVARRIRRLEETPYAGHLLTGNLRGARSLEFSLKGSGVYRAVYFVTEHNRICLVFIICPRENIYDKTERRIEALRRSGRI